MTGTAGKKNKVEVPYLLSEAVKNGRAILFLGAGASKECRNPAGDSPPNANQLRDVLSQKYFGKLMPNRSVMSVAEMAIEAGAGRNLVFETVNEAYSGFACSEAHKLVSDFNWRTIATTNYDTFVETAYSDTSRRRQTLVPFVKDDEPVDEKMRLALNPVQYLKLHGCLNHRNDNDIPLVLSWDQYAVYSENRKRLFSRLVDLSHECPIIFVGYGMGDSHIRDLVYKLDGNSRPRWYIVDPSAEEEDIKFWSSRNFDILVCRFGEFMTALDESIPKLLRFLAPAKGAVEFPLRLFYKTPSEESDAVKGSLSKDLILVHASMSFAEQTASTFYSGYDTGWGGILNRYDARRKVTDDILYKALLENERPSDPVFLVLRGPAGAGKTVALKRAAFDAATANKALVLWLQESGQLRSDVFFEISDLVKCPIYLFIDQVAVHVDKLIQFIASMKARHIPIVIVGAEREADWATYCGPLDNILIPQFVRVGHLSAAEVDSLLDLLERHDCLGELKGRKRADQIEAFMAEEQADRQLLVALHVLTRGLPFERIVLDEYESVNPERARRLYLDIATMNQFGVTVRAGTISRASGISFREYEEKFFSPLKDIIAVVEDPYTQDYAYRARHSRVAQILFRQVCTDDVSKVAQFIRLINGFDVGFSSDSRALEAICRGRSLNESFVEPTGAREIYRAAIKVAPRQAYLYQQWAIFESTHPRGELLLAEEYADIAAGMEPRNLVFVHTQAEVARKRANLETSPVLKEQLRRRTRAFLGKMSRDRFSVSSRCKLLVDEISDLSRSLLDHERESEDRFFAEKLKEAESTISAAHQEFPEDAELFEIEARLWNEMKDNDRALKALERAWKKVPRGTGTAIRLGKLYSSAGRSEDQYVVLKEALDRDPEDKAIHFAMAMHILERKDFDHASAKRHLVTSFSVGDQNFEPRYILAQLLFAEGQVEKSIDLFAEIYKRAPGSYRRFPPRYDNLITENLPDYSGSIDSVREGFYYIRSGAYPKTIFAHRSSFDDRSLDKVELGQEVNFRIRFNRGGPVAVNVRLKQH